MDRCFLFRRPFVLAFAFAVGVGGVGGSLAQQAQVKHDIAPELDRATLVMDGRLLKPTRTSPKYVEEHAVKNLRVQIEGGTIRALKARAVESEWTATAADETKWRWLAADANVIYFADCRIDKRTNRLTSFTPLRVRRLEIDTGNWLDDLPVEGRVGLEQTESIQAVLSNGSHIVVLTVTIDEGEGQAKFVSYSVYCFKAGATRPVWSKVFATSGIREVPEVVRLLASLSLDKAQPNVQSLNWLGERILVCAGPKEDLVCLDLNSGKEHWRTEKVWEFERGFVGPSVWQHFISRFGKRTLANRLEVPLNDEARPARTCAIIGGPIVVSSQRDGVNYRTIFVAVSKGPLEYGTYVSDCVVYELNAEGNPLAMVPLPRIVRGGQYQVQKDGVVWACQGGAFVKVGTSLEADTSIGIGPGGRDCTCPIDWYRRLVTQTPDAWLKANPTGDPIAMDANFAIRVPAGGYITDSNSGLYHFPLALVDLNTSTARPLVLNVPYQGEVPKPQNNYSRKKSPQGQDRWHTSGPYLLAITRLQLDGQLLRVTLGMEGKSSSLDFDIGELIPTK